MKMQAGGQQHPLPRQRKPSSGAERKFVGDHRYYLPVTGGSFKAPRAISNSSAAASASVGGGVGKGKLITYRHQEKMPLSTASTPLPPTGRV